MAFNIGELVGYVKIDHSGARTGMQAAEREIKAGMSRTAQSAEQGGKEVGGRFSRGVTGATASGLKVLGAAVVGGFALDRVIGYLGDATQAASDLQQTAMKSNVIFGDQAASIDQWASNSVDAFGLSKTAALAAAAGFGDMLQQLGDTQDEAAKTSQKVVEMAADLGSFNNLETGDVLDRISAALRGEYDSLQSLIPNINAARVEQEAMAETGKANAAALTAQEKAHATLAIIQKDGSRAQGDFARSAGTFAIEQQKAAARSQELQAEIGAKLLPIMTAFQQLLANQVLPAVSDVVGVLSQVPAVVADIPGPVKAAVGALVAFHLLKGPVGSMLDTVRTKATSAGDAIKGLGKGGGLKAVFSDLVGSINPWTVALGAASFALGHWMDEAAKAEAIADQLGDTIDKTTGKFTAQSKQSIMENLLGDLSASDIDLVKRLGVNFQEAADKALTGGDALNAYRAHLVDMMNEQYRANGLFSDEGKALEGFIASLGRSADGADKARAVQGELGTQADKTAAATDNATDATKGNTSAQKDNAAATAGSAAAQERATAAMQAHDDALSTIRDSLAEVGDATDELSQKVQDKAQKEADATKDTKDGWQDYADGVKLSAKDIVKILDEQTKAAKDWRKNLLVVQQQGDEQFTAWVSQQPAQVAQAYASGTAKQRQRIYDAYKRNVGAQQALGVAKGLEENQHTVTDKAGNVYTAVKNKLTGRTILIPVGVTGPSGNSLAAARARIYASLSGIQVSVSAVAQSALASLFPKKQQRFGGPVGPIPGYASGTIVGPGTGTSDSVLAFVRETGNALAVSNGEFISTDWSRRRNLAALEAGNHGATLGVMGTGSGGGMSYDQMRTLARLLGKEIRKMPAGRLDVPALSSALAVGDS